MEQQLFGLVSPVVGGLAEEQAGGGVGHGNSGWGDGDMLYRRRRAFKAGLTPTARTPTISP
jgi:hypothetical protein